jgi:hypothetical protein
MASTFFIAVLGTARGMGGSSGAALLGAGGLLLGEANEGLLHRDEFFRELPGNFDAAHPELGSEEQKLLFASAQRFPGLR